MKSNNYFAASPNSLVVLQGISVTLIIIGYFYLDFNWQYALTSVIFFYLYSIIGISMMLHRYYTHKSFELHPFIKWLLTSFAVLASRGSVLGWVYVHRIHHATSDTEKDPHSPHSKDFKFLGFKPTINTKNKKLVIVRDLISPIHLKIDQYYMLIILVFLILLGLIDYNLVLYVWALPVFFVGLSQLSFNYFAHMHGYRNFNTKDRSTNNIYLWPLILGDAWHNNHHANAEKFSTQVKKFELDPLKFLIRYIRSDKVK